MSFTSPVPAPPRWRDVYVAATCGAVSMAGDFLAATALVLALQSRGGGSVAGAGVLLASTVPLVVLGPMTGRLADRVDSRTLLVAVGLVQAVVCAVLAHSTDPVAIVGLPAGLAGGVAGGRPAPR